MLLSGSLIEGRGRNRGRGRGKVTNNKRPGIIRHVQPAVMEEKTQEEESNREGKRKEMINTDFLSHVNKC